LSTSFLVGELVVGVGGGEAGEGEVEAAGEVAGGGFGVEGEALGLEFGEEEGVDGIGGAVDLGDGGLGGRDEGPPGFAFGGGEDAIPGGAGGDPVLEQLDLIRRQRIALRRHEHVVVLGQGDDLMQVALGDIPRHQGRAGLAALEHRPGGVEAQAALGFLDAALLLVGRLVAVEALLFQHWQDLLGEIHGRQAFGAKKGGGKHKHGQAILGR